MLASDDTELAAFVKNSNAIEGIFAGPSDKTHFGHHLAAAKFVRSSKVLLPIDGLHAMIMINQLESWQPPGAYRHEQVYVGTRAMPKPDAVPALMNVWHDGCAKILDEFEAGELVGDDLEEGLVWLHSHALSVHPFPDGNGRTFRLFYNHLRQLCGLPWRMFDPATDEWFYLYAKLRDYETRVFKLNHPSAYDPDA